MAKDLGTCECTCNECEWETETTAMIKDAECKETRLETIVMITAAGCKKKNTCFYPNFVVDLA